MASNLMKVRVTERAEDTDEDEYNVLDDVVRTLTKDSKNTRSESGHDVDVDCADWE